jgi:hypothetical protein
MIASATGTVPVVVSGAVAGTVPVIIGMGPTTIERD